MRPNTQETADLVTFTEETHNGKLHALVQCGQAEHSYFCKNVYQVCLGFCLCNL